MSDFISALIILIFTFGTAIFYVLSCIERSVFRLVFDDSVNKIIDDDIRFVHASLKRLVPLLPPSNGFVVLFGTAMLIFQGILRNWDWVSILIIVLYWSVMIYIIFFTNIKASVKDVRETSSEAKIEKVRLGVRKLIIQHHLGLIGNLIVVIFELILIFFS